MNEVLTPVQLKRLSEHTYSAEGVSVLEPFMQKFWRWLVEQIPLWWAPNAITLAGLLLNLVTTFILILYSPDGKQDIPLWVCFQVGLGLFIYQCMDAIDGKQARRTNSASPLGELFDHGCDSLSTVFVCIGTCLSLNLGTTPTLMFLEAFTTMFLFYSAHWQTYCTGTLKFGRLDVTEAQFAVIFTYVISGLLGPAFWETKIPLIGLEFKIIPIIISISAAVLAMQMYFSIIVLEGGVGKNGSTVAGTSVLSPVVPIGILYTLAFTIWLKSPSHLYENHPVLYILSFGMAISKVTNKLVVAHMTKSEMALFDSSFIGPGLLFLNQYFNIVFSEHFVLWVCFFYTTGDLLWYSTQVCRQICDYLNIYCFVITPPSKSKGTPGGAMNNVHSSPSRLTGHSDLAYEPPITRKSTRLQAKN